MNDNLELLKRLRAALEDKKPKPPEGYNSAEQLSAAWKLSHHRASEISRSAFRAGLLERVKIGSTFYYREVVKKN